MKPVWPALAVLTAAAALASASPLFVDQKHAAASDQNPGTEAKPFKTLQPAVNAARPGDTIWVKAGRYDDPVRIGTAGTLARPITLSAWKDDRVCIGPPPAALPPPVAN